MLLKETHPSLPANQGNTEERGLFTSSEKQHKNPGDHSSRNRCLAEERD